MAVQSTLRGAFRNFSTLGCLVLIVALPAHVTVAYLARRVISLSELHGLISTWPEEREFAGVGATDLDTYHNLLLIVSVAELLLLPIFVRATRRILDVDRLGGVPTLASAFRSSSHPGPGHATASWRFAVVPLLFGVLLWLLTRSTLRTSALLLPSAMRWSLWGTGDALALAMGAPFVLTALAGMRFFGRPD